MQPERCRVDEQARVVEFILQADLKLGKLAAELRRQGFDRPRRLVEDAEALETCRGQCMADRAPCPAGADDDAAPLGIEHARLTRGIQEAAAIEGLADQPATRVDP